MAAQIQRDLHLWFDDGSIALQAESIQFRVYRGILAANSPVFKDMFSLPQPNEEELVEGCPVVTLHDSAVDMGHFLRAIHDAGCVTSSIDDLNPYHIGRSRYYDRTKMTEFALVAAVLRLSSKYNVEYLRERAIAVSEPFIQLTPSRSLNGNVPPIYVATIRELPHNPRPMEHPRPRQHDRGIPSPAIPRLPTCKRPRYPLNPPERNVLLRLHP
jgi:hypothetical protein